MKVQFINNDGGGFAESIEVAEGTTIEELFQVRVGKDVDPAQYLILVNKEECVSSYTLQSDDKVTCTPINIKGA